MDTNTERKIQLLEAHFGRPLDAHEKLMARLGEITVCVMGAIRNGEPEYILVPLGPGGGLESLSEGDRWRVRLHGYTNVCTFSYAHGEADAVAEPGADPWRICVAATPAFLAYLAGKLAPQAQDDSVSWLDKLYSLKDERENLA